MNIDYYTANIKEISIPVSDTDCKRIYAIYRTPHYITQDGYSHRLSEELFNVYTDRDIAEMVKKLIEE